MADVIVVGGGPAGISAAVYLRRFKLDVLVLTKDKGALGKTEHIDNYYGFSETISGPELVENGIAQARRLGVVVLHEEVLSIDATDGYLVKTTKAIHSAKAVLLATGASRVTLRVKGFNDFLGKGISYCAICDGFLYRNRTIGLVGAGDFMHEELEVLKNFSQKIKVFTNGTPLLVDLHDTEVVREPILSIGGSDSIEYVETASAKHSVDVLFLAIGTPSATDFALRIGAFINNGEIAVDENFMTNVPGLFAAGDCIGGLYQIAKAVSDGAHVGLAINRYLKTKTS